MRLSRAFVLAAAAYMAGVVVGILYPYTRILDLLKAGAPNIWEMSPLVVALIIFAHNAVAAVVIYATSMVLLGLALVALNGYMVSVAAKYAAEERGFTLIQVIAALLPHGVIEIPALLLASAAGMVTLRDVRAEGFKAAARGARILLVSLVLLFVAAFIEAFVTPSVARAVGAPVPGV